MRERGGICSSMVVSELLSDWSSTGHVSSPNQSLARVGSRRAGCARPEGHRGRAGRELGSSGPKTGTRTRVPLSGFFPYGSPAPVCFIHSLLLFSLCLPFHRVGKLATAEHGPTENSPVFSRPKPTATQGGQATSLWLINQDQEGVLRTAPAKARCSPWADQL